MNVQLKDITVTARDGRVSHLEQVYIRGSHVRFFIVPDMLRYARVQYTSRSSLVFPIAPNTYLDQTNRSLFLYSVGTPPCSAPATSAAAVSVSLAVVPQSAGRALVVVAAPDKGDGRNSPKNQNPERETFKIITTHNVKSWGDK